MRTELGIRSTSARTLGLLRAAWLALLVVGIAVLLLGLPAQFAFLRSPCRADSCTQTQQLAPEQLQELEQLGLSIDFYAVYSVGLMLLSPLVFIAIAALVFSRKSDDRMALFCSFMLLAWGVGGQASGFTPADPLLNALVLFFRAFGNVSIVLFFFLFPTGQFIPRWTRWFALAAAVREVLDVYFANFLTDVLFFAVAPVILLLQLYRYRRVSNALQRQQTKWVVMGAMAGISGYTGLLLYLMLSSTPGQVPHVATMVAVLTAMELCLLLVPISIGVAILRSHLWDIDLIIRRTLIYGALTAALALVYFGTVVALQEFVRALTGQSSDLAIVASTLFIAALFSPLRRAIQTAIDLRLYRRKYNAERVLTHFGATMRDEVDLGKLKEDLLAVVNETMQPANASLWIRATPSAKEPDRPADFASDTGLQRASEFLPEVSQ